VREIFRRNWTWLTPLLILILGWGAHYFYAIAPLPFDRPTWDDKTWNDPRHKHARIADRLISSGALIGKSREELITLLGQPPPPEYFRDWDLVYNLGAERGYMSIDSEWLVIRLDSTGRATEATIVRD
jgi:hypothetical protein